MKANKWIKKHYKPIEPSDIALPIRCDPICILVNSEWYEVSYSDYEYYIKLSIQNDRINKLKKRLNHCEVGYKCSIDALPFMPDASKSYTEATADRYLQEMESIKKVLEELI